MDRKYRQTSADTPWREVVNDHRVIALGTINEQASRTLRALKIAIRWIAAPFIRELILSLTASAASA